MPEVRSGRATGERVAVAGACAAAAFLFFFRPIADDDVWLHFTAGRWILDHGKIPTTDEFSCTAAGAKYIDHEWLAQVIFEGVRRGAGLVGFRVLLALASASAFFLLGKAALRQGATPAGTLVAAAVGLSLLWHVARLRPHLLTLLFSAILVERILTRDVRPSVKGFLGFALLVVLWANCHAAAVVAPALLAFGAVGAWLARERTRARGLAVLAGAAAALLLVNPYGAGVYTYALDTQALARWIPEWKPLAALATDPLQLAQQSPGSDFRPQILAVALLAAITIPFSVSVILWARRSPRADARGLPDPALAAVAALLTVFPFTANRHDLFLPVPAAFVACAAAAWVRRFPGARAACVALGSVAALVAGTTLVKDTVYRIDRYEDAGIHPFSNVWPPHTPKAALDFVEAAKLEGCCAARLAWGGSILFQSWPRVRVAFDGRITTYGESIYLDMVDFQAGRRCPEVAAKYGFDFAVVQPYLFGYGTPREAPLFRAPDLTRDWLEVYRDADPTREGSAVVALRRGSPLFEANLERVRELRRR